MYFSTELSKIHHVSNIQINFWVLFFAQNNLKLVFFLKSPFSQNKTSCFVFFHILDILFTYFIAISHQFFFELVFSVVNIFICVVNVDFQFFFFSQSIPSICFWLVLYMNSRSTCYYRIYYTINFWLVNFSKI